MAKQVITSDQLYPVYGPYSHAVRAGDFIFLHGTVGLDPQGRLPGDTPGRVQEPTAWAPGSTAWPGPPPIRQTGPLPATRPSSDRALSR